MYLFVRPQKNPPPANDSVVIVASESQDPDAEPVLEIEMTAEQASTFGTRCIEWAGVIGMFNGLKPDAKPKDGDAPAAEPTS